MMIFDWILKMTGMTGAATETAGNTANEITQATGTGTIGDFVTDTYARPAPPTSASRSVSPDSSTGAEVGGLRVDAD
jgi:hypothetical protein